MYSFDEFSEHEIIVLKTLNRFDSEFIDIESLINETGWAQTEAVKSMAQLALKGIIEYHGFNREKFAFEWRVDLENVKKHLGLHKERK